MLTLAPPEWLEATTLKLAQNFPPPDIKSNTEQECIDAGRDSPFWTISCITFIQYYDFMMRSKRMMPHSYEGYMRFTRVHVSYETGVKSHIVAYFVREATP